MARRRSNTTSALPTPAPENIATREYYRSSETNDAHDRDIEYPADRKASPPPPAKTEEDSMSALSTNDICDFVEVSRDRPYSPSPSGIVADCELEDTVAMSDLNRDMREKGMERAERKVKLLALREKLSKDRKDAAEEAERARVKVLDEEYDEVQRKGREEV